MAAMLGEDFAPIAPHYRAMQARWGDLVDDRFGPVALARGEEHRWELWTPNTFRTPRDAARCDGAPMLRLHWTNTFRPGELAAHLDARGRVWGFDFASREDQLLLAEHVDVYVERLVRAMSCRRGGASSCRHPDAREAGLHGAAWAHTSGCALVPEASDAVMQLWESDDVIVVEDRFSDETTRWNLR